MMRTGMILRLTSTYTPATPYKQIAGNDDFVLYMQHQQGVGGAAGIVKALNGTGKMHPETVKTKSEELNTQT
jgi:hypothetical protein